MRLLGGGARSATWRQIIADVTGLTIKVPVNGDASFGAALVAAVGCGDFRIAGGGGGALRAHSKKRTRPDPKRHEDYKSNASHFTMQARQGLTEINHQLSRWFLAARRPAPVSALSTSAVSTWGRFRFYAARPCRFAFPGQGPPPRRHQITVRSSRHAR